MNRILRHPIFWLVVGLVAIYIYSRWRVGALGSGQKVPAGSVQAGSSPVVQASQPTAFNREWGF